MTTGRPAAAGPAAPRKERLMTTELPRSCS
jgi:hypothetical protein